MPRSQPRATRETSAGGVIFRRDPDGRPRFLLIRDSYRNWGFPKGHLEPGEPPADAARREVAEETALVDLVLHGPIKVINWYFRFRGKTIHKFCHFFLFESRQGEPVPQAEEGITACTWHPLAEALALAARFPRIPMYALSSFRPDDGPLLAACRAAGVAGVLVEGVDNAVAGEWVAARTAQARRRAALADGPRVLRLTDHLQRAAW